jgi:hypothetical protein
LVKPPRSGLLAQVGRPDFATFDRLAKLGEAYPAETLTAVEIIANDGDEHWTLRTQKQT